VSVSQIPCLVANSGKICGVEALIRWNHPKKDLVPPDDLIPILESSGLIVEVGQWVLMQASAQQVSWRNSGFNLRTAVNVSARQLQDDQVVCFVKRLFLFQSIQPAELELELTESSILHNDTSTISALNSLSEMGISLSLIDFGTGYSSLSHLKNLPIFSLKIDRSFIGELLESKNEMSVTTTILAMAKNLSLKVVAEGVETAEQSNF